MSLRRRRPGREAAAALLTGLAGAGLLAGVLLASGAVRTGGSQTTVRTVTALPGESTPAAAVEAAGTARALYLAVASGVVDVTAHVSTEVQTPYGPKPSEAVQAGAGTVLDRAGHILTAEHVIQGATSVSVKVEGAPARKARVVGRDAATDVAVLRIDPRGLTLHPARLGTIRSLRVGDTVFAIGDPFGFDRSLSSGLVSGLDRTIEAPNGFTVAHAIQTDAAVNPGNSGGPLLNADGEVVGIVDQIATGGSGVDSNTGVAFAVPVDVARSVIPQLERGETPAHAYLGVEAGDATAAGAVVGSVAAGSPAAKAGLRAGDVIVAVGPTRISGVGDLVAALAARRPGEHVTLTVRRSHERLSLAVALAPQPNQRASG